MRIWGPGFDRTLITNVLEPERLSPEQLMAAYQRRWSVERMYLAMREVLYFTTGALARSFFYSRSRTIRVTGFCSIHVETALSRLD